MEGEVEEDEEVDANELLEALQSNENNPIEILHEDPPRESNTAYWKAVSLIGVRDEDDITKDAEFLQEISKMFDRYEISVICVKKYTRECKKCSKSAGKANSR